MTPCVHVKCGAKDERGYSPQIISQACVLPAVQTEPLVKLFFLCILNMM